MKDKLRKWTYRFMDWAVYQLWKHAVQRRERLEEELEEANKFEDSCSEGLEQIKQHLSDEPGN